MAARVSIGRPRQRKSLGQCFLRDQTALETIATALGPLRQKTVIEIGGGDGALTKHLLEAKHLIVYELDRRFAALLRDRFTKIEVRNENFLEADLAQFNNRYLLTGNIPYAISGLILRKVLTETNHPEQLVFTVQKEYAERLLGLPHENFFSAWVRVWGKASKICSIKRTAFSPVPKVDSIAIKIDFFSKPLLDQPEHFAQFLKLLFKQPRKTIVNNLKQSKFIILEEQLRKYLNQGKPGHVMTRPHELNFDQILYLYRATKE